MIRISSGLLRGLQLSSPAGNMTRPTTERTRQSIFNILRNIGLKSGQDVFEGKCVGDLFAGTGALGFEALSQGAEKLVLVESNPAALKCLEKNVKQVRESFEKQGFAPPRLELFSGDISSQFAALPVMDLVFIDPPYGQKLIEMVFELESSHHRMAPSALVVLEHGIKEVVKIPAMFQVIDGKNYGDSTIEFLVKS